MSKTKNNKKKHLRKTRSKRQRGSGANKFLGGKRKTRSNNKIKHTKVFGGRCALPRPIYDRINEIRDNNGFADNNEFADPTLEDVPEDFDINNEVQEIHRQYNNPRELLRELMNPNIRLDRTSFRIFSYVSILIYLINSICYHNSTTQYHTSVPIDSMASITDDISRWDTSGIGSMGMSTEPFH